MLTLHQRFALLRKALSWSWKDIARITSRKNPATNITKRVPAWAHLAIHAHEAYAPRLRLLITDAITTRLGAPWSTTIVSSDELLFQTPAPRPATIRLRFTPATLTLSSTSPRLPGLVEQLAPLFPDAAPLNSNTYQFPLLPDTPWPEAARYLTSDELMF